jgi:peptidoglycan/LPS O-acetylase OafA/YrhL
LGWWVGVFGLAVAVHSLFLAWGQTDEAGKGWQFGMTGGAKYWWPAYNPVGFFATFVIGVLAAGVADSLGRRPAKPSKAGLRVGDVVVVVSLVAVLALLWTLRRESDFAFSWPTQPYYFPLFPLLFGLILAWGPHSRWAGRLLDNPPARFIATISFGLYIWHYLFLEASQMVWSNVRYFGITDLGEWAWKIGVLYGLATVVATLSWYFFEKPIVLWSQRQGKRV